MAAVNPASRLWRRPRLGAGSGWRRKKRGPGNALPPIDRRVTVATPRYGILVGRAATVRNTDGVRARKRSGPLIVESRCGTFRRYVIPEGAVHTVGGAKTIRDALGSTHGTAAGQECWPKIAGRLPESPGPAPRVGCQRRAPQRNGRR